MPGLIPSDATNMYLDATALGAAPDGAIDPDTQNALHQQALSQDLQNQSARQRAMNQLIQQSQGIGAPASAYTQTNHGLQALPHIQNDE